MAWPMRSFLFFIGLPVLGIGALTMYLWHKKEEEEWSEITRGLNITERDVRIPQEAVAAVVGRDGCSIRRIEEETKTKLSFRNGENHSDYTTCKIVGKSDGVSEAVDMVMEIVANYKATSHFTILVPATACGRIIGRCGDTVRSLRKQSGARIEVDRKQHNSGVGTRTSVSIYGTEEQIKMAVSLIEEKVKEDEVARNTLHLALSKNGNGDDRKSDSGAVQTPGYEKLLAGVGADMLQEVYLTAVSNPNHFWVQVISPRAADLDHMLEDMTDYYNKEENRSPIPLDEIKKGQIVACLQPDDKWYRVEVSQVETRSEPPEDSTIDVFFVDWGESEFVPLRNLSYLRTEYLTLRFQAIQVQMVGIAPPDGNEWSEEAIEMFAESTKMGHWYVLMAEVIGYKKRKPSDDLAGIPIPCVRLYDPEGPPGVDLGQQLIQKGLAVEAPVEDLAKGYEVGSKEDEEDW